LGSLPSSRATPADVQPPAAVVPTTEFDITVETVDGKLKVTGVNEVE
jgi:hypothetical protein